MATTPPLLSLPPFLTGSWFLHPLLTLALDYDTAQGDWLSSSMLVRKIGSFFKALQRPCQGLPGWIQPGLHGLHWLGYFAVLLALPVLNTTMIGGLVWLTTFVLGIRLLLGHIQLRWSIIDTLVTLFFATAVLSTAFSSFTHTSLIGLVKFMTFYVAYANARVLLTQCSKAIWWVSLLFLALGCMEAVVSFYQYVYRIQPLATWQDPNLNPELKLIRVFGTLQPSNPNLLAGYLIHIIPVSISLSLIALFNRQWLIGLILSGLSGLTTLTLVLTGSRGGYLAIAGMMLALFFWVGHILWHEPTFKKQIALKTAWALTALLGIAGVVGAIALMPAIQHRVLSIFSMRQDSSNSFRLNVWGSVIEMIRDNWLVGIGPGNNTFKLVYGLYMVPGYTALSAYSIFLEIWVEQGILGIVVFSLLWLTLMLRAGCSLFTNIPIQNKLLIGGLWTGILGSTIYGCFDTIWYRPSVNVLFWCLVAALAVLTQKALSGQTDLNPLLNETSS